MNKYEAAYLLGSMSAEDYIEKTAIWGALGSVARGAGRLAARGYGAAAPRVSQGVTRLRASKGYANFGRQLKHVAKDTAKSPFTYLTGGYSAYSQEGSLADKALAGVTGGAIAMGAYGLSSGAARSLGAKLFSGGANRNKAFMKDLMSRGLSKKDAYKATMGRSRAIGAAKSNNIADITRYKDSYKDATKGLKFMDKAVLNMKYNKGQIATGGLAMGLAQTASSRGADAVSNVVGVGPQQQARMYDQQGSRYPTPPPHRSSTISGTNNPYSR